MSYYESILILMGEQIAMSQVKEYVFAIISTVLFSFLLAIIFGEVAMFTANFNELPLGREPKNGSAIWNIAPGANLTSAEGS